MKLRSPELVEGEIGNWKLEIRNWKFQRSVNAYPLSDKPSLFYCNPLFDLSLGNYDTAELIPAAAEMGTLFIPCARAGDRILLSISVPDEYWEYLTRHGLECPEPVSIGKQCSGMHGVPWGWNREAYDTLLQAEAHCVHPDLSIVREVNSRKFSLQCNRKTGSGVPGACYCAMKDELMTTLDSWQQFPLVIKPDYGNAGYGFIRKESRQLFESELKQLDTFFVDSCGVIIEPWYTRTTDISSRCTISPQGSVSDIRHHRTLSNRAGTFFADVIDPHDEVIARWRKMLDLAVKNSAIALHGAGYFGPAGFDSFEWVDKKGERRLAPVIEINARHPMSSVAYALHDKLAPDNVSLFRFIGKKRHRLPDTYVELKQILGGDAYNPETKRGILLVTPPRVSHTPQSWIQPARSAFFIAEESSEKLLALDEKLRKVLIKSK